MHLAREANAQNLGVARLFKCFPDSNFRRPPPLLWVLFRISEMRSKCQRSLKTSH